MDTRIAFWSRSKMPTVLEVLISLLLQLFWKILNDKTSKTIYFHAIVCNVTPRAKWWTYFLLQTAKYPYDVLRQRRIMRINAQIRQKEIKTFYPPPGIIPHGVESTSYIRKYIENYFSDMGNNFSYLTFSWRCGIRSAAISFHSATCARPSLRNSSKWLIK